MSLFPEPLFCWFQQAATRTKHNTIYIYIWGGGSCKKHKKPMLRSPQAFSDRVPTPKPPTVSAAYEGQAPPRCVYIYICVYPHINIIYDIIYNINNICSEQAQVVPRATSGTGTWNPPGRVSQGIARDLRSWRDKQKSLKPGNQVLCLVGHCFLCRNVTLWNGKNACPQKSYRFMI